MTDREKMTNPASGDENPSQLPLVLVTVGGDEDEFQALQQHLDSVEHETEVRFQSLVVARPDLPKLIYNLLCARIDSMDHVYIRRLGDKAGDCSKRLHESGTFLVTR